VGRPFLGSRQKTTPPPLLNAGSVAPRTRVPPFSLYFPPSPLRPSAPSFPLPSSPPLSFSCPIRVADITEAGLASWESPASPLFPVYLRCRPLPRSAVVSPPPPPPPPSFPVLCCHCQGAYLPRAPSPISPRLESAGKGKGRPWREAGTRTGQGGSSPLGDSCLALGEVTGNRQWATGRRQAPVEGLETLDGKGKGKGEGG